MSAPPRLLDDPAQRAALRDDLAAFNDERPDYDAAAGARLFAEKLAAPPAADGGGANGLGGVGFAAVRIGLFCVAGAALGAAIYAALQLLMPAPPAPAPHNDRIAAEGPEHAPAPARVDDASPAAPPHAQAVPTPAAPPPSASVNRARTPLSVPASRREVDQLLRIRQLLPRDPAAALKAADASALEFPSGALRQEREGLSVIALFALGEADRAQRRAAAFLASYPQSPLRARIERLAARPAW